MKGLRGRAVSAVLRPQAAEAVHELYPWILFGAVSGFDEVPALRSQVRKTIFVRIAKN